VSLVVLDTDVASNILRGRISPQLQARLAGLAEWRRDIVVLPADEQIATTWGALQARAQLRGQPRPINDTWIAASCIVEGIPLATFNTKDYEDFAQHDGLTLFDVS
jgi:toxin FitB